MFDACISYEKFVMSRGCLKERLPLLEVGTAANLGNEEITGLERMKTID